MANVVNETSTTTTTFTWPVPTPLGWPEVFCMITAALTWVFFIWLATGGDRIRARILGGDGSFRWDILRKQHVTHSSRNMSSRTLGVMRLLFALCCHGTTASALWLGGLLGGALGMMTTFTGWSWQMLGLYFWLSGFAALTAGVVPSSETGTRFHLCVWVAFEVMMVIAVFVTFVVYFVLIPHACLTMGVQATWEVFYADVDAFIMHHFNVIFILVDAYYNRMLFVRTHVVFAMMYGNVYIVFSWLFYSQFGFFWYFFLDGRYPFTWFVYLVLILVLYGAFLAIMRIGTAIKRGVEPALLPQ